MSTTYVPRIPLRHWSKVTIGIATTVVVTLGGVAPASLAAASTGSAGASTVAASSGTWTRVADISREQASHSVVPLSDGRALLLDRYLRQPPAERYDPGTGTWRAARAPQLAYASGAPVVTLADGRTLFLGGSIIDASSRWGRAYGAVGEIYDPTRDTWTTTSPLNLPRTGRASATLLPGGRVLVVGGHVSSGSPTVTSRAEIYDPATDTWTEASDSGVTRYSHVAVLLRDGTVLVAGGFANDGRGSQIYDPATDTWSPTGSANARLLGPGFLLPDGTVLVAGKLYDPATRTWVPTNGPGGEMVQLTDGRVLGINAYGDTRIYNPGTRTSTVVGGVPQNWGASPNTDLPRVAFSLTALRDGTVLTTGGYEYDYVIYGTPHFKDAHVFTP